MKQMQTMLAASLVAVAGWAGGASAGDKETVQVFYDFLSNPSSETHAEGFLSVAADNWESIGDYSGKVKSREALVGQISGFGKLIPDLTWTVEEMLQDGDRVIVRGRATGTPVGPLFGVDGQGRSFEIMSIDIHTMEDGKIARSYHVEDWAGALAQLSGR